MPICNPSKHAGSPANHVNVGNSILWKLVVTMQNTYQDFFVLTIPYQIIFIHTLRKRTVSVNGFLHLERFLLARKSPMSFS
jgi:hypothetical protein